MDDIRCLYCDGKLPLYRKIASGQFCSTAHRRAYWQEQERLAVERLNQTHNSLHGYRPPDPAQATQGQLGVGLASGAQVAFHIQELARSASNTDRVCVPGFLPDPALVPRCYESSGLDTSARKLEIATVAWTAVSPRVWFERILVNESTPPPFQIPAAGALEVPLRCDFLRLTSDFLPPELSAVAASREIVPVAATTLPIVYVALNATPDTGELFAPVEQPAPRCEHLFAIPVPSSTSGSSTSGSSTSGSSTSGKARGEAGANVADAILAKPDPLPIAVAVRTQAPLDTLQLKRESAALASTQLPPAEMQPLGLDRISLAQGIWTDQVRGIDFGSEGSAPVLLLSTPAYRPRLRLAAGNRYQVTSRYHVEGREGNIAVAEVEPARVAAAPPHIPLPPKAATPVRVPNAGGLLPLACNANPSQPPTGGVAFPDIFTIPQPLKTELMLPNSKLEPLDVKPVSDDLASPPESGLRSPLRPYPGADPVAKVHVWTHAVDFWEHAPRDLRMLAFAIPILLGLALHPSLPKVRVTAPATTGGIERGFKRTLDEQLVNVKQTVAERAAVALKEDFRSGLDDWTSRGDLTTSWSFDENGFVRPGPLAIYRPTMGLSDYQMQFLGMIDKKALSWVVRAADYDNYYVVKLVVLKPGPLPTIGVTRYAVIDGKPRDRADAIAPVNARPDTLYRVRVDVNDDRFVLTVQGQIVDSWSEPRLKRGGIGFFSAHGEESRVRWVQVTHQYDMLGRLCAYLAPYNIPSTNGSW